MQAGGRDFPLNPKNMDCKNDACNSNKITNTVLKRRVRVMGMAWAGTTSPKLQSLEAARYAGKDGGVRTGLCYTLLA